MNPAYQLQETKSAHRVIPWKGYEPIWKDIKEGYAVLWQHHMVFTGQITNGHIQWLNKLEEPENGEEHLVRLRAFNENQEYHFWRSEQEIKGRLRQDGGEGEEMEYIDTKMIIRSVVALPLRMGIPEWAEKNDIRLLARNYVGHHPETFQIGYIDSRFVNFIQKKGQ